jgi:hypothetical protein
MTLIRRTTRLVWRFARFTRVERRLLVQSFLLLLVITAGLRLMPLLSLQRVLSCLARNTGKGPHSQRAAPDMITWAVTAASNYVPGAACLSRALTLQVLLEERGWRARLCIGIGLGTDRRLQGHAWVEGIGDGDGYQRILTLAANRRAV